MVQIIVAIILLWIYGIAAYQLGKKKRKKGIIHFENERAEWALKTFPEATAISSLEKCLDEIEEIHADIKKGGNDASEYVDGIMCLFDSAKRRQITAEQIEIAYGKKVAINKSRRWIKNANNTYSHIK